MIDGPLLNRWDLSRSFYQTVLLQTKNDRIPGGQCSEGPGFSKVAGTRLGVQSERGWPCLSPRAQHDWPQGCRALGLMSLWAQSQWEQRPWVPHGEGWGQPVVQSLWDSPLSTGRGASYMSLGPWEGLGLGKCVGVTHSHCHPQTGLGRQVRHLSPQMQSQRG
jgi:hypothetical protein